MRKSLALLFAVALFCSLSFGFDTPKKDAPPAKDANKSDKAPADKTSAGKTDAKTVAPKKDAKAPGASKSDCNGKPCQQPAAK